MHVIEDTASSSGRPSGRARSPRLLAAVAALVALAVVVFAVRPFAAPAATAGQPAFVQTVSKRAKSTSVTLQPTANVSAGNRLIVEVGVWSSTSATASTVTDSAGNTYTKLTSFTASEHTELSVWTAPINAGGGTRPTITVKTTGTADIGAAVLEYSGLSAASGTGVLDQIKTATATTGSSAATVSSGATAPSTAANELALGVYNDSGFGNALAGDASYATRTNVSPTGDMEFLVQDKLLAASGTTANPSTSTGPRTPWLAATLVLKGTGGSAPAALAAPAKQQKSEDLVYSFTAIRGEAGQGLAGLLNCPLLPVTGVPGFSRAPAAAKLGSAKLSSAKPARHVTRRHHARRHHKA